MSRRRKSISEGKYVGEIPWSFFFFFGGGGRGVGGSYYLRGGVIAVYR